MCCSCTVCLLGRDSACFQAPRADCQVTRVVQAVVCRCDKLGRARKPQPPTPVANLLTSQTFASSARAVLTRRTRRKPMLVRLLRDESLHSLCARTFRAPPKFSGPFGGACIPERLGPDMMESERRPGGYPGMICLVHFF